MDIATKKIELAKRLFEVEDEVVLLQIQKLLKADALYNIEEVKPMTVEELEAGINQSLEDIKEGRLTPVDEVIKKYQ